MHRQAGLCMHDVVRCTHSAVSVIGHVEAGNFVRSPLPRTDSRVNPTRVNNVVSAPQALLVGSRAPHVHWCRHGVTT